MSCVFCKEVVELEEDFTYIQAKGSSKDSGFYTPGMAVAAMYGIEKQLEHLAYSHKCTCDNLRKIVMSRFGVRKYFK